MKFAVQGAIVAGLLLLAGSALAAAPQKPAAPAKATQRAAPAAAAAAAGGDYLIGPQDVLSVNVWKEPEVSANQVPVRPDGKISLPLLGDVQAAGLSPAQLTANITEQLKRYISEPRVTVTLTAINSQRFYIMGEVTRPGAFPLAPNTNVLQGLANGGGFTEMADPKKVYVLRTESNGQVKLPFNYREVVKGHKPEQNILLRPGDTIVVP